MDNISCRCIISYLVQQGYPESALALAKSCGAEKEVEKTLEGIRQRRKVLDALLAGNIPEVLQMLRTVAPQILELRQDLLFMLRCQHFIELVKSGADMALILEYGSNELQAVYDCDAQTTPSAEASKACTHDRRLPEAPCDEGKMESEGDEEVEGEEEEEEEEEEEDGVEDDQKEPETAHNPAQTQNQYAMDEAEQPMPQYREIPPNVRSELLEKVFSLVAYVDPTVSPHAFLLNPMMRTVLADELNSAMQSMVGWNKRPTLERLSRQVCFNANLNADGVSYSCHL